MIKNGIIRNMIHGFDLEYDFISNLLTTSKELNKQVFDFLRHTGIVKTAID